MTNKISIGIDAQFDSSRVEQKINALGAKIAQANKVQYNPVSVKSTEELAKILKQFEQLRRVSGDLNKRMKSTGQGNSNLVDVDWDRLYPDQNSRARQMRKAFEYSVGPQFHGGSGGGGNPNQPGRPGPRPPQGPTWGGTAVNVAQAGMRAAGPAGGVAAGAMGTGMSAGFGAGLMGLMGGMLALGVGKIVSGVMEKMDQAEANNVGMDKLKRTLGDVNVSFDALKAVVHGSADNLKITYDEAGRLGSQFVKLGNVTNDQYKTISDELGVGVGMSRAFGMDPSQGVGVMGQMRGIGVTSNTQDSKRFALLIGETIGKSNAFAKSEEVMEAIAGFATSQTRNNMGAANVGGYAGMFSSMVGSGIPGLDSAGAGALLGRINAALSAGGAKGEASQFFTGSIGSSMGLNPYQTRMLREGGAFATGDGMFGEGSAYARYKGRSGPGGSTTFLQASLDKLRGQYGNGSDELADATANHMGIGINQAMALLSLKPNEMGEMNKYAGDLTKMSGSGIGNLSKALYGTAGDRQGLAGSLLGRADVSSEHKNELRAAMGGGESEQKEVLAKLTAQYDQERTLGSDIRDSKNVLDNIKVSLADKLVPIANEMRHGIMYMAGVKDGMSPKDIMEKVMRAESKDKSRSIGADYDGRIAGAFGGAEKLRSERAGILAELRGNRGMSAEDRSAKQKRVAEISDAIAHEEERARQEILDLQKRKKAALDAEVKTLEETVKTMRKSETDATATKVGYSTGAAPGGAGAPLDGSLAEKLAAAEKANGLPPGVLRSVMTQETGKNTQDYLDDPAKYHYGLNKDGRRVAGHTGKISTAFGPFGILESTGKKPGYGVSPLKDKGLDEQIRFASEYLAARSRSAGSLEGGLAGYGEGGKYSRSVMSRVPKGGTPMPEGAGARPGDEKMMGGQFNGTVDVNLGLTRDARRLLEPQSAPITGRVSPPSPYGALRPS